MTGNVHEVARLCHVMGTAATSSDGRSHQRWCEAVLVWTVLERAVAFFGVRKLGLHGCRVGKASNPGPRVKGRRVESSVSETESDVDFLAGLEEDPAWCRQSGPRCHSRHPQSPFLREFCVGCPEVHCSNHYARCQCVCRAISASTLIDPMEQEPTWFDKNHPDLVWFR